MILEPGRCRCSTYFILVLRYSISVTVGVVLHCPRVSYLPANRLDAPPDSTHETPSACLLQGFICLANVGLPLPRALEFTNKHQTLLEMMQHPCRGCCQTFSVPCIILIYAPLGGYICSLESPLRRISPLPPLIPTNSPCDNGVDEGTLKVAGTCAVRIHDLLEIQVYWQRNDRT